MSTEAAAFRKRWKQKRKDRKIAARLPDETVRFLRDCKASGYTSPHLAELSGINPRTLWDILSGRNYKHV